MKNYSVLTTILPLPVEAKPGQVIPAIVSLPNNALPLQVEYYPAVAGVSASLALHHLVPCDEKGNIIEEEIPTTVYEIAWNELYKLFGERSEQDNLDVMKAVMFGVMTEKGEEEKQRKGE